MANISFLGLGKMGLAMATHLLRRGHQLNLYNRTVARAELLVRNGARVFKTPREACHGAVAIISMVADDPASQAMWCGSDGALAADLSENAVAIECSTLSHGWVKTFRHSVWRLVCAISMPPSPDCRKRLNLESSHSS